MATSFLKHRSSYTSIIRLKSEPLLDIADRNLLEASQLFRRRSCLDEPRTRRSRTSLHLESQSYLCDDLERMGLSQRGRGIRSPAHFLRASVNGSERTCLLFLVLQRNSKLISGSQFSILSSIDSDVLRAALSRAR